MFRTLLNKNGLLFGIYLISIIILTISLIIANRFFEIYYDNQTLWTLLKIMGIIGVFVAFNQKRINKREGQANYFKYYAEKEERTTVFKIANPSIFYSAKKLKKTVKEIALDTPKCNRCEARNYSVLTIGQNAFKYKCDSCDKRFINITNLSNELFKFYNNQLKLIDLKEIDIYNGLELFEFDKEDFKKNTPLLKGIKFQGLKEDEFDYIDEKIRTRRISQEVKDKVWNRDFGKCVECGSNENLEFDHIIPHSKGGANTYRNIQLLCESCNRSKSDKIG